MCGILNNGTMQQEAFIGCFDINKTFFNTAATVYIAQNLLAGALPSIIKELYELEVYKNTKLPGKVMSIVAVGKTDQNYACVFEASGPDATPLSGWTYAAGESTRETETMTQITITKDYIVTGGTISNYHDAVKMRVFNKNSWPDIFSSYAPSPNGYNDVFYFPANNTIYSTAFPLDRDNWQMTALDSDYVAIASFWQYGYYQVSPTYYEGVLLHVYNTHNMLTTPNIPPHYSAIDYTQQSLNSVPPFPSPMPRINDLRYNFQKKRLNLLMTTDCTQIGIQSITAEIRYPAAYPAIQYRYINGVGRHHLDNIGSFPYYISSGSQWLSSTLVLYANKIGSAPVCDISGNVNRFPTGDFTSKMHTYNLDIHRDVVNSNPFPLNVYKYPTTLICRP